MSDGRLPCEDCVVARYGAGRGQQVRGCDQRILSRDVGIQSDVPEGGAVRFHLACYDVWQAVLTGKD